jgi:hypothetical protein
LYYAYLDEAGAVSNACEGECFLVIAVVSGEDRPIKQIGRHIKHIDKRGGQKKGNEVKATNATQTQRKKLLSKLAGEEIAIIAVIMDKRQAKSEPEDHEEWYRQAVGEAVFLCASRYQQIKLTIDKRYTTPRLRARLETAVKKRLGDMASRVVEIEQKESHSDKALQAIDYIAWAIRRKFETGEDECYQLIQSRIVEEQTIRPK